MVDRISLLLKAKNINASQFADEIGVQRSSISHVLSGRNKPSLEFVQKILKRYPEISPDWLLFGKGPMNMEVNLFSQTSESVPLKEEAISNALRKNERMMRPVPEEHSTEITSNKDILNTEKESVHIVQHNLTIDKRIEDTDYKQETDQKLQLKPAPVPPFDAAPSLSRENEEKPIQPQGNVQAADPAKMPSTAPLPAATTAGEKQMEKVLVFFSNRTFREYNPE